MWISDKIMRMAINDTSKNNDMMSEVSAHLDIIFGNDPSLVQHFQEPCEENTEDEDATAEWLNTVYTPEELSIIYPTLLEIILVNGWKKGLGLVIAGSTPENPYGQKEDDINGLPNSPIYGFCLPLAHFDTEKQCLRKSERGEYFVMTVSGYMAIIKTQDATSTQFFSPKGGNFLYLPVGTAKNNILACELLLKGANKVSTKDSRFVTGSFDTTVSTDSHNTYPGDPKQLARALKRSIHYQIQEKNRIRANRESAVMQVEEIRDQLI